MIWNEYPYSNVHELNLDWIIKRVYEYVKKVDKLDIDFKELKDYVVSYFDNLDIQEEVNNKLDEMAESGELAEIIAQYLELQSLICFNDKVAMKNAQNLVDGSSVITLGTETYNDGYTALYKVRELTSGDVIDDYNIIALVNYPELIAERIKKQDLIDLENNISEEYVKVETYGTLEYDPIFRYYIDETDGDDNNDGLTKETAFKTLEKFLSLSKKGKTNIRAYINVGTYELNAESLNNITLHLDSYTEAVGNVIINIINETNICALYNCHVNIKGTSNSKIVFNGTRLYADAGNGVYSNIIFNCRLSLFTSGSSFEIDTFNNLLDIYYSNINIQSSTISQIKASVCMIRLQGTNYYNTSMLSSLDSVFDLDACHLSISGGQRLVDYSKQPSVAFMNLKRSVVYSGSGFIKDDETTTITCPYGLVMDNSQYTSTLARYNNFSNFGVNQVNLVGYNIIPS